MYKIKQITNDVIRIIIPVLIIIQSLMGLVWLADGITIRPVEKISFDYIEAAQTLVTDDYMGIGYALIIRLIMKMAGGGTCLFVMLYVLQLISVAGACFLLPVELKKRLLIAGFVTFNPLVLETICQVSPNALLLAGEIALISCTIRLYQSEKVSMLVLQSGLILVLGLLNPDYIYIVLIMMIPVSVYTIVKKKKLGVMILLGVLVATIISFGITRINVKPYSYERGTKSIELYMMQRFCWPDMSQPVNIVRTFWGAEADEVTELYLAEKYSESVFGPFSYFLETKYGTEVREVYALGAKRNFAISKKQQLLKIAHDILRYTFPQAGIVETYARLANDTRVQWDVMSFVNVSKPGFAHFYLKYSIIVSFVLTVISVCFLFFKNNQRYIKTFLMLLLVTICLASYYAVFEIRGFDYRLCGLAACALPMMCMIKNKSGINN